MTDPQANPPLAVTDADRSEAADLLLIVGFSLEYIAETKAGSHDDHAFVQAFARHRLSTQTPNAAALVVALDLAARELEAQANDPDQEMAIKAAAAARQALAASSPPTQGSGGASRLHISLCADLRAGKNVGLEAAAAIESLERELSSAPSNTQGALEAAVKAAFTFAYARGFQIAEETSRSCIGSIDDAWEEYQALKSGEAGL